MILDVRELEQSKLQSATTTPNILEIRHKIKVHIRN